MVSEQIVLFDIPTRAPRTPWSYNLYRARLLLHYKDLDFRTEWLEYPEIAPRLQGHVPPHPDNDPPYTLPAIQLPSSEGGLYVMDSLAIAHHLNAAHPSPPLPVETPQLARLRPLLREMMVAVRFAYVALVYHRLLSPASQAHWRATREAHVGMDMDALHARYVADRAAWDAAWAAAEEALGGISALLSEEKGGPFFLGEEVSWADFVWGGVLLFFERIGEDVLGELLTRAGEGREVHLRLLEALRGWAGCEED